MSVFISYSSKEYREACLVNEVLKKNGVLTWMAPESIPGGSNYTREIPKAISSCKIFLLILSDNAQKSRWVSTEVENAFKKEKIILPFVIESFILNDEFDFLLSQSQRIEAYEKKSKALEELVSRIKSILKSEETSIKFQKEPSGVVSFIEKNDFNKEIHKKIYDDGSVYEGEFVDGKRNGKGKYTYADGTVYEGDFIDGNFNGKGKYTFANGDVYEGDFIDDKRTGKGKYTFANGTVYEGDFVDDSFTGKGKYSFTNGDVYEGDWINDKRTGKGKYTYANGDVYEGEFIDGKRTGKGKFIYQKTNK